MSARNGQEGKGNFVGKLLHPRIEVGRAVEGYEGGLGKVDASETMAGIRGCNEGRGLLAGYRTVHLVAAVVCFEVETQAFFVRAFEGGDVSFDKAEWFDTDGDIAGSEGSCIAVNFGDGRSSGVVCEAK